jgi:predicted transcriptional regulator
VPHIYEVITWYALPAIRKEISSILKKKKFKVTEIGNLLELTPAAVSQYLHSKRKGMELPEEIKKYLVSQLRPLKRKEINKDLIDHLINESIKMLIEKKYLCSFCKAEHLVEGEECNKCYK